MLSVTQGIYLLDSPIFLILVECGSVFREPTTYLPIPLALVHDGWGQGGPDIVLLCVLSDPQHVIGILGLTTVLSTIKSALSAGR